ncbi:hypothetical protein E4665_17935 [Sporolactobacillus shoreae]|uniref:DUF4352 domain-containing protein n=1 Tax=Sporolactobacillus shoreae TaxID=1465501 RepID=A0A4Z0GJB3_9BACL|nr:hypothetical protein [Sporolactobacillus shoreae]TGA95495.1 hypothetical protein E4665_17935 [Sporolactobacillus shoreae]
MKKIAFLLATIGVVSSLMSGCSTGHSPSKSTTKKAIPSKSSLAITSVHVTKNDGQNLDVTLTADNHTDKAIYVHPSEFALSSDSTTLSSTAQSNVPSQIPADSITNITLDFKVKGQLSGTIKPKVAFQPIGNQPEQFESLGNVTIPVPKNPVSKSATSESTSKPSPNQTPSQPLPSMTYNTDTYGQDLTIIFHNLGQYSPSKLEMIVPAYPGNDDIATIVNGAIQPDSSWQMNNGNLEFSFPHADWGANTVIKVTCTAPGKNPITLSFPYKVPQN